MTSQEAYYKFTLKINKGSTQFNAACDKNTFVLLFNETQRRWLNKNTPEVNADQIANVQSIIVNNLLTPTKVQKEYVEFDLPKDWFSSADCYIFANYGECKNTIVNIYQTRSINVRKLLADEATTPSFDFRETFYTIEHDKIKVYKNDFDIVSLSFNYYKEPKNISIAGGVDANNNTTQDVHPELADIFVDQIISEAATEFMRNWMDSNGVALAKDRQNSEN